MKFRKLDSDQIFVTKLDRELLEILEPYYHAIAVNMECEEIKSALDWPFLPENVIFGEPIDATKSSRTMKRVKVLLDRLGGKTSTIIVAGLDYYQFMGKIDLTPCVYKKIEGEWHYHLHPSVIKEISDQYGI